MGVRESRPLSDDLSVAERAAKQENDLPHFNLLLAWMVSLRTVGWFDWKDKRSAGRRGRDKPEK